MTFAPSKEQQDYFDWVANGTGNALVSAVAGSGKTTTLINGLQYANGSICMMAYNKKAAVDMQEKAVAAGVAHKATIGTVHSFGFALLRGQRIFPKIDEWKRFDTLADKHDVELAHRPFIKQAVSLAKQRAFGLPGNPGFKDEAAWNDLVETFSLTDELAEDQELGPAIAQCSKIIQASKYDFNQFIDFDDMIWLPLALGIKHNAPFKWVFLDEAQDTNPARRCLAKALLASTGRLVAVGDPAQAIYGFTGADNDSLEQIARDFNTSSLPLHTSFRCAKAIVEEARKYVSHITAFSKNPEGLVETKYVDQEQSWLKEVTVNDVILCRNTRPLVSLAFRLIKSGRAAKVEGRKIGEGLKALAKKLKYNNYGDFCRALESYRSTEVGRLLAKKKNFAAQLVNDKTESLIIIADTLPSFSRNGLVDRIDTIFAEGIQKSAITLCTIHRSKGLEWNKVFWYLPGEFQPSPFAQQAWELDQEQNLMYVAATRAKSHLVILERKE